MRILILSQWFDPEPTPRGLAFAKALLEAGNEVEVITGFPNYPGGRIYPGYKMKWRTREVIDGVVINRVALYPSHDQSALKRILNHVSFFISSCLYGIFCTKKPDIIYVYTQPILVGLSGTIISFFKRTPFIIDIQDMWPDSLRATGMLKQEWALSIVDKICNLIYRRASNIVVLSPGFEQLLIERAVPADKIQVIYNWCDEQSITSLNTPVNNKVLEKKYFNVVYAGTMGKAQALDAVISAAQKIAQTNPMIKFTFIGGGVEKDKLQKTVENQSVKNIHFLPKVPTNEIGSILCESDVLLVHLKDDPLFEITIPSKVQAYLHIGKPILIAVKGDAADLVLAANAGINVEPENTSALMEAILQLSELPTDQLEEMGHRGARFYKEHLSMQVGVAKFLSAFNCLVSSKTN